MAIVVDRTVTRDLDNAGIRGRRVLQLTGDISYATGGYVIAAGDVKLGVIEYFPPALFTDGTTFRLGIYNYSMGKLQLFVPNTNVEVAAAVDLRTFVARVEIIGKP